MRRLTAAVFGTIGLLVAGATAYAIEGSTWLSTGVILVDVRIAGLPRFSAQGPFENTFTGILSNQVFVSHELVPFTSNATATADIFYPGTPTLEPTQFTQTVAKFGVDFDAPPGDIPFVDIIEEFTGEIISELMDVPVNFVGTKVTTSTASTFQGIEIFEPTLKAKGQFRAFNDFSEMKGGFTISGKGRTFFLDDSKPLGRATLLRIRHILLGTRNS